jgi:uncharacterized alkaline shock family protein YloU
LLKKDNPIMNVFNRIIMILLSLAAIAFSIIVFLLVGGVVRPTQVSPGGFLLGLWRFFSQLNPANATIAVLVCALVVIASLILLILELNIFRREPAQLVVRQDGLGKVTVARSSVRKLVGHEAAAVPGVIETRQAVDEGRDGLRVHVRVLLLPEVDAPAVGHTLQERVQKAIQEHVGLPVAEVQVATQIEPFEKPRRPRVH